MSETKYKVIVHLEVESHIDNVHDNDLLNMYVERLKMNKGIYSSMGYVTIDRVDIEGGY